MVSLSILLEKYFPKELYAILSALSDRELTAMEICRVAKVSHGFLLGVLPSLRFGGFVSITKGQTDKRVKHVRLTDGGRYLLEALEIYRATLEGNYALIKSLVKT